MLKRMGILMATAITAAGAFAFPEVPFASAKALQITRGKKVSSGVVFINGKYIRPPYVVERWGTGIRINGIAVTGQVVDWTEFLKTQSGVKVTRTEEAPPPVAVAPAPSPTPVEAPSSDPEKITPETLDALFADAPAPTAKSVAAVRKPVVPAAPPKPKVTVTYSLEGDFVPNAATKALVGKINVLRTDIDGRLRGGGFIFFGDRYSRVTGDERTAAQMMQALPGLMQNSDSAEALMSGARSAGMYYLNEMIAEDLYRNRVDYRKLQERWEIMRREAEDNALLKRSAF